MIFLRYFSAGLIWLIQPTWSAQFVDTICRGGHNGVTPPSLPDDETRSQGDRPPPPQHSGQGFYGNAPPRGYPGEERQQPPGGRSSQQVPNPYGNEAPPSYPEQHQEYVDSTSAQQNDERQPQLPDSYDVSQPPPLPDEQKGYYDEPPAGAEQPPEDLSVIDDTSRLDISNLDKEFILRGVARLYRKKILPLELASKYALFQSPPLSPSDFDAPPMVLLLGQYSVGKTSFIRYLLGRDFPGIRVGPEPTTDRFTAVLYGERDKIVPGAALCSQTHRPFTGLSPFGNNFLSRMEGVELDSPILRDVTLVDTPGILSGQKQRSRSYDYEGVMKWFAERADLIIVMFDAHKLDISDELQSVMELMVPHLDKLRIVLNKADSISTQQLMRVYGALMWSLGKVMNTPEVCRVYMGSFWDQQMKNSEQAELLQREERDLLRDIQKLPQQAIMRKINDLVKRARAVKVHAYIIHYLRKQLPYTWGKKDKQARLIGRLDQEMMAAARRYGLPRGDFPPVRPMQQALSEIKDLSEFPKLDKKLVKEMDKVFTVDIPGLLEQAQRH